MALINCWECDNKISDTSEACPNCGAPSEAKKVEMQNSLSSAAAVGIDSEIQAEMMALAKVNITRKKLLNNVQDIVAGSVHEKFFNTKGSGEKVFAQVYWKHFSIDDHSKDKSFETHVSKKTGSTSRGNRYVQDVNVTTTTTHYDYVAVHDKDGKKFTYRLTDCGLSKLSIGQVVSLGWVQKAQSTLVEDQLSSESWDIGQTWEDVIQPSIFISHSDLKSSDNQTWEALPSTEFQSPFISNSLGIWHTLWLVPAACFFLPLPTEILLTAGGGALTLIAIVKGNRVIKTSKHLQLFSDWYRSEADRMLAIGTEKFKRLI